MSVLLQVFYSVFSSLMVALALPNEIYLLGCPFYALFALIPFYYVIKNCRSFKNAFWVTFLQTITVHLMSSFWLGFFKDFAAFTLGASALGTGLIGGAFGLFLYVPYRTKEDKNSLFTFSLSSSFRVPLRILYFAAVYTLYEWYKSIGFLGYPWGTLSTTIFRWNTFMQIASITGTYGITFLLVLFSALVAEGFDLIPLLFRCERPVKVRIFESYTRITKTWAIFIALSIVFGLYQTRVERNPEKYLNTILVQQNSDPWKNVSDTHQIETSIELTKEHLKDFEGEKPHLVVWSEGVLQRPFPGGYQIYQNKPKDLPLTKFIKETKTPFVIGGSFLKSSDDENLRYYNSGLAFDEKGNFRGYYPKNHLVPFAEAIPFTEYKAVSSFIKKFVGISAGWTAGDIYTFFEIPCMWSEFHVEGPVKTIDLSKTYEQQKREESKSPLVKISTPICFDDAFPDVCRPLWKNGSEVFINLTDDSWSLKKSSEYQHFCVASYRAIELRTTLVRSTNAGYSAIVDPTGKIIYDMPLFEEAAISAKVPVYKRQWTTYALLGNWLPYTLCVICLAWYVYIACTFDQKDYIASERKIKKSKKHKKHHKKDKKHHK